MYNFPNIAKNLPYGIHNWDWKETPNWITITEIINTILEKYNNGIKIIEINNSDDEFVIVIGDNSLTEEIATLVYHQRDDIYEGKDLNLNVEIDWESIINKLNDKRIKVIDDIHTLRPLNDLYKRFSNGERSLFLAKEIEAKLRW